jgi:hypothetical protein
VYDENEEPTKIKEISALDKHLKTLILRQAISLMKPDITSDDVDNTVFEKIFPPQENPEAYKKFTVYNDARVLFELLAGYKRPDILTLSQFQKL